MLVKFFGKAFDMSIQRGELLGDIYMIIGWLCGAIAICFSFFGSLATQLSF
jgi:hypothetical protein